MVLAHNITIDRYMKDKIDADSLQIPDHLLLALASYTAALYPLATTYVGAQQQGVDLPAVFVDYYSINHQQRLADTSEYEFGIEITYIPTKPRSSAELANAVFTIQQSLHLLPSKIGEFTCYSKSSDITDGIAHVTGIVRISEADIPTDPIIINADKELIP